MNNRTLTTSSVTIEDVDGTIKQLGQVKEGTPVGVNNEYIGNINSFGELTLPANITNEVFNKLLNEVPSNKITIGVDYGSGIDETIKTQITHEIKNIHRVRKGKRYVIKFDYTNYVSLIGKVFL